MADATIEVIRKALRFAEWAAGEGLEPAAESGVEGPEDFLYAYSTATGDEEWDGLGERIGTSLDAERANANRDGFAEAIEAAAKAVRRYTGIDETDCALLALYIRAIPYPGGKSDD